MIRRIVFCFMIIAAGLALRRYGYALGLPFGIVKYGGSVLWGAMVFGVVDLVLAGRRPRLAVVMACLIALVVELSRLYHTPTFDALRLTTPGALLLGRVFSPWNLVAYAAGIALAAGVARLLPEHRRRGNRRRW